MCKMCAPQKLMVYPLYDINPMAVYLVHIFLVYLVFVQWWSYNINEVVAKQEFYPIIYTCLKLKPFQLSIFKSSSISTVSNCPPSSC